MAYHHGDLAAALVAAGRERLRETPAAELSLRDAARAAGVSHAAPQRHFPVRDDYLVAVATACLAELVDAEETALAALRSKSGGEPLLAAGEAYVRWAASNPHAFALAFDPAVNTHGATASGLARVVDRHTALFSGLVADALGRGVLDARVPPLVHAAHLWSTVHGMSVLVTSGRLPPEAVAPGLAAALGVGATS